MVDVTGIKYRLGLDTADTEARIREEFEENQLDSRAAVRFAGGRFDVLTACSLICLLPCLQRAGLRAGAGVLVVVPLLVGLVVSRLLAEPFFEVAQRYNPDVFALTDKRKVEGAKEIHKHELRLRMDAALGRAPPITEPELQACRPEPLRSCTRGLNFASPATGLHMRLAELVPCTRCVGRAAAGGCQAG